MNLRIVVIASFAAMLTGCSHMPKIKRPSLPRVDATYGGLTALNPAAKFKRWKALNSHQWIDKNDDGMMDYAEFQMAADKDPNFWVKASQANAHIPDFISSEFKRADTNGDSYLSPDEFLVAGGGVKALR